MILLRSLRGFLFLFVYDLFSIVVFTFFTIIHVITLFAFFNNFFRWVGDDYCVCLGFP